jgi:hypothetical protein
MTILKQVLQLALQTAFLVCLPALVIAQGNTDDPLGLIAEVSDEGIRLRWGYENAQIMRLAIDNGFTLTRSEVSKPLTQKVLLEGVKPLPEPDWTTLSGTSRWAASIEKILYDLPEYPDPESNQLRDQQAEGLMMFAADHDFAAAVGAALGFFDRDIDRTATYRYTIAITGLSEKYISNIDVKAGEMTRHLPPQRAAAEWIQQPDFLISLGWFRHATDTVYTSYYVERTTEEGNNWQQLNENPLMPIISYERYDSNHYYNDPTADRDVNYRYRIFGMTPFGTYGPPSEVLEVSALYRPLVGVPYIKVMTQVVDSLYRVEWIPGEGDESDVASYRIATSDEAYGEYVYQTDALPPGTIQAPLIEPRDVQYVRVEVTDRRGTVVYSQPKIIRVFDQVPPAPPTGLSGEVDSLGNVTLRWAKNKEADLSGYRVYTANRPNGYFPQLTKNEWFGNAYRTEVTMDTRAEEVYYKVKAVDYTGNYSDFSEVLELIRPDFKPPTPPLIKDFRGEETGVNLMTAFSSSDDVAYHLVQRMEGSNWLTVDTVRTDVKVSWLTDTTAAKGVTYDYRIVAVDDVNLRSYSEVIAAGRIDNGIRAAIPDFDALIPSGMQNFTVTWSYPVGQNLRGFQLYRAKADGQLEAYKFLTASSPELQFRNGKFIFLDRNAGQSIYTYQMMAVHHDGGHSPLTQAITVTRPN